MSKAELQDLATKQHLAVSQFLNRASIKGELTEPLADSKERVLLIHLLRAHLPIKYDQDTYLRNEFNTVSSLSSVAKRLIKFLEEFSDQFNVLRKNRIRITVPTRLGGVQLGKYLACQNMVTLEYLDDVSTRELLQQAWLEFREKQKREAATKRQGTSFSVEDQQMRYLQPIDRILRIGQPEESRWFRKTGPVAADFHDGKVYRRETLLADLREVLLGNAVSMLKGHGATGKTVVVRCLAYDLFNEGQTHIYYFDCDRTRDFDQSLLIRDMRSVRGIFILENIHFAPEKFQALYFEFKHDSDRHVLFTARPSVAEFQYSRSESLTEIKTIELEPFVQVDALIAEYCSHRDTRAMDQDARQEIQDVCDGNLWLVSYALEGYAAADGRGHAKDWLERGIKEDLNDLRKINTAFPEVLVSISPLYRNEVLTAESYLTRQLGFESDVLDQLIQRGEATRQEGPEGHILYGLTHTVLADLYWTHGSSYKNRRGLTTYEDFIYRYAKAGTPNSLEAVLSATGDARDSVFVRLDQNNELGIPIQTERSVIVVQQYLHDVDLQFIVKLDVITALSRRLNDADGLFWIPMYISILYRRTRQGAKLLQDQLNQNTFARKLNREDNILDLIEGIEPVTVENLGLAREICTLIDMKDLSRTLAHVSDPSGVARYLSIILRANAEVGRHLWAAMDKRQYATKISEVKNVSAATLCLHSLASSGLNIGSELCGLLDVELLATTLKNTTKVQEIGECISVVLGANRQVGELLWRMCRKSLVEKLRENEDLLGALSCVTELIRADAPLPRLTSLLDLQALSTTLIRERDMAIVGKFISGIHDISPRVAKKLWLLLDKNTLADAFNYRDGINQLTTCLRRLQSANPTMSRDLCVLLNLRKLALALDETGDLASIGDCVVAVHDADKTLGLTLLSLIDKKKLAHKLSHREEQCESDSCIDDIYRCDPDTTRKICDMLDVKALARYLSKPNRVLLAAGYFADISRSNRAVGRDLWQYIKKPIAVRLSSYGDSFETRCVFKSIRSAAAEMATELCGHLDLERLARVLDEDQYVGEVGEMLSEIFRANEAAGRRLWDMLDKGRLSTKLREFADLQDVKSCVDPIASIDRTLGHEVCCLLDFKEIAARLNESTNLSDIATAITTMFEVSPTHGRELWSALDKLQFAANLSHSDDLMLLRVSIGDIALCDPDMAQELCGLLSLDHIASVINRVAHPFLISVLITAIFLANKKAGMGLWSLVDQKKLAADISRSEDGWSVTGCIRGLSESESGITEDFCTLLDLVMLAKGLVKENDDVSAGRCVSTLMSVNQEVGQRLLRLIGDTDPPFYKKLLDQLDE